MPFEKGHQKHGGRTRGTPNRLPAKVKEAIQAAFDEVGGKDYLVEVARTDPRVFCALLAKLVPAEVRAEVEGGSLPTVVIVRDYTGLNGAHREERTIDLPSRRMLPASSEPESR
jgi:hypothetical protein